MKDAADNLRPTNYKSTLPEPPEYSFHYGGQFRRHSVSNLSEQDRVHHYALREETEYHTLLLDPRRWRHGCLRTEDYDFVTAGRLDVALDRAGIHVNVPKRRPGAILAQLREVAEKHGGESLIYWNLYLRDPAVKENDFYSEDIYFISSREGHQELVEAGLHPSQIEIRPLQPDDDDDDLI